jgi:hypothetical protein
MKRLALALGLALALAVPLPAMAVNLHTPHEGTACPSGYIGTWHFVNNQTGGASAGSLTATFDGGAAVIVVGASKVLRHTQHFYVVDTGRTLDTASTNLPGKLVLSDFSCEEDKKKGG